MFKEKVAVITGGVSGIGKATVLKFVEEGASVAILDSDNQAGIHLATNIRASGGKAVFIYCNVSNEESVKTAIAEVIRIYGRLDYAYNNAGIGGEFAKVENYPVADWDKVIAINLKGVFLCMKYEIPYILKQGRGAIVNCASLLSIVASENDSA